MKKVAFVCVHNSCRSQMAEAFGRVIGLNVFEVYSAGTEERDQINQDAVRIMKEIGIDMNLSHKPKLLTDIPPVDIVITMGCNVNCPNLPCSHREDWGLDDPSGKSDEDFRYTRDEIKSKVMNLLKRIENGEI
ncbi:MAG TPA: low molecular weight phosphatase family protein [Firmicutes bacterium]|nr:low molecular weight phosphatase family protein [Bacillota bacterium]